MPAIRPIFNATPRSKTRCGSATNVWRAGATYSDHAISGSTRLRPGYQKLLEDARKGEFDVVVAEALDRLSRNQEDVASLYKHLGFVGVRLLTLAEGEGGSFGRCRNSASWTRSYGMR